jgi:glyoxylase-like metal-dependent hydrolase (beta-lactamase superfamily II)
VENVELLWSSEIAEIRRLVVGPLSNNVFIVTCRQSGQSLLIDAANEAELLLEAASTFQVKKVLTTHGHWDHVGAVEEFRAAEIPVLVGDGDKAMLSSYDETIADGALISCGSLRLLAHHTPGHTPGSTCFSLLSTPLLFTGDTLFPGGPGNATFEGGDFTTIITSLEKLYAQFGDETIFWPGHGDSSTIGTERPHLAEWIERGW